MFNSHSAEQSTANSHDHTHVPFVLPGSNHTMQTNISDGQSPVILTNNPANTPSIV